ncbi:hypothetical protein [Pelagibacterium limicola]|uniref:hypothetical protein n=1 Tax=Pelagibacterium limicola TaxID=2791022 RepID=UPI0018B00B6E|nr:hypothetical protein [Pelagibacterium limicola]
MTAKSIGRAGIGTVLILLIPLVLTIRDGGADGQGWDWSPFDFLIMGALLFVTWLALDFTWRRVSNPIYRALACAAILGALFLIWVELAVDAVSWALGSLF